MGHQANHSVRGPEQLLGLDVPFVQGGWIESDWNQEEPRLIIDPDCGATLKLIAVNVPKASP